MSKKKRCYPAGSTCHCYQLCLKVEGVRDGKFIPKIIHDALTVSKRRYNFRIIYSEVIKNRLVLVIKTKAGEGVINRIMGLIKSRVSERQKRISTRLTPYNRNNPFVIPMSEESDLEDSVRSEWFHGTVSG